MQYSVFAIGLGVLTLVGFGATVAESRMGNESGTEEFPIVDSAMTTGQSLEGLALDCPNEIRNAQVLVDLLYWSFDKKVHRGQLVVDRDLADDVKYVFDVAFRNRFPIQSIVPVADRRFRKGDRWDDDLSMAANNTSAFNYRAITGAKKLSNHAYGRAIDINPIQNPYVKGDTVLPPGASYDLMREGTLGPNTPIVKAFLERGWEWGGNWTTLKDYQHFEKPRPQE